MSELPLYPIPLLIELRTYACDKKEKKCDAEILQILEALLKSIQEFHVGY